MSDDVKLDRKDGDEIATIQAMTTLSEIANQLRELAGVLSDLSKQPLTHSVAQGDDQDTDHPQSDQTVPTLH